VKGTRTITHRSSYGFLEFIGDVGGTYEFVRVVGFLLTKGLLTYTFLALFANRMYIAAPSDSDTTYCNKKQNPRPTSILLETPLEIPSSLQFWTLLSNSICRCCFKDTKWDRYEQQLKRVKIDYERNLDITVILRRLRMNGFAINYLMKKKVRIGLAEMTRNKPIRYISTEKSESMWH